MTSTAAAPAHEPRPRRPWTPDGNDHLIFHLVKMQGRTQDDVATQLRISQATVSRIVHRYERWQAHAKAREAGRLDHAERLRAQRCQTYERNELMLAACLRIAGEMERVPHFAKTTLERSTGSESSSRTRHEEVDRSGVAARFYRLAFRINMEQLKLCERDPLEELPPLSADEIAEEEELANAATAEMREGTRLEIEHFDRCHEESMELQREIEQLQQTEEAERAAAEAEFMRQSELERAARDQEAGARGQELGTPSEQPANEEQATEAAANVNKLHKPSSPKFDATGGQLCCCAADGRAEKNHEACITEPNGVPPPQRSGALFGWVSAAHHT